MGEVLMKQKYDCTWETVKTHPVPEWFEDYKFGIFIHWGIYSVPAYAKRTWELGEVPGNEEWFCNNPYAEWYYNSVNVGRGPTYDHHLSKYGKDYPYENFVDQWKAEKWNPEEWVETFRQAGAKYVVLVAKHHDGFCLFPSKYTAYNAVNRGPQRDIVGELTREVRKKGLKMGLYYSAIIDWRFANEPIYKEEDNFNKSCPTFEYADYAYKQSVELIDRYQPSVFWNDIGWPVNGTQMLPHLLSHYYNEVEEGLVNDRFNGLWRDFATKEYKYGSVNREEKWEMCRGMGLSFGYNEEEGEEEIISVKDLISLLVGTVANNGNLLINIGPKADGTIPEEQKRRLMAVGKWLEVNGEAIYGTRCSKRESLVLAEGVTLHFTSKGEVLYLIVDQVKEKECRFVVPDLTGELLSLTAAVEFHCEPKGRDLGITIYNHKKENYAIAFKVIPSL